ncbi:hypothetical protein [Ammoniphilus sp. YIM 78166]|uniref:hypothetical protein n=1 Tax=Ammoniphilus sp. YIM 78166 TaxID=1644106 RepID=UPI00106F2FC4|nr:hypothetical protein [Ammoniphilus sp. YIM 78166]
MESFLSEEVKNLQSKIKSESDVRKKYFLFGLLLEIYEEWDMDIHRKSSVWKEFNIVYEDYMHLYDIESTEKVETSTIYNYQSI